MIYMLIILPFAQNCNYFVVRHGCSWCHPEKLRHEAKVVPALEESCQEVAIYGVDVCLTLG